MKKIALSLLFLVYLIPSSVYAAEGLIKPSSRFYFLQTWKEKIQLVLSFSKEKKLDYLLSLTEKRVEEMQSAAAPAVTKLYEEHYQSLDKLATQMENKERVAERIRENSLRQQEVLAKVYSQVPEPAKAAIINAQENSSKQVTKTVERVEGMQKAQEYVQQVGMIQMLEKTGQVERLEQVPMESSPNANPAQAVPLELKQNKGILPGQGLNPLNPTFNQEGENTGNQRMEPAEPIQMNETMGL